MARESGEAAMKTGGSTDRWHGGIIYYDKTDPSILVPKREGLGYTLNFARPMAWLVLLLLLIAPVLVIVLVTLRR
jgi:uncharacterized membrane protein